MTEPETTPPTPVAAPRSHHKKPVPKEVDTVQQLQKLVDAMAPEERERLERLGVALPRGDLESALRGHFKYGIRCTQCNNVALFFVGDSWKLEDGSSVDYPPGVAHNKIAWTQELPASEIDRHSPRCQHCKAPVPLNPDDSFRRDRGRIVEVGRFHAERDAAIEPKKLRQFRQDVARGGGGQIEVAASYDKPDQQVSAKIAEQRGGPTALKEIEQIADITGVTEALRKGFQGS